MATGVGLLCSRVRVEEKGILAALSGAGVPGCTIPPDQPLPAPVDAADSTSPGVIIDRYANRTAAPVVLGLLSARGVPTIDAGLAARGDRVEIALALQAAGLPRPEMQVAIGEAAALALVSASVSPMTLLPLTPGLAGIALWDLDTAEAVLEHRSVLGGASENVFILQQGAPVAADRVTMTVVGGVVVGVETPGERSVWPEAMALAAQAARVLRAGLVGVELVHTAAGWVIWDIVPVPDFRTAIAVGCESVAAAIADLAIKRLGEQATRIVPFELATLHRVPAGGVVDEFAASI